MTREGAVKVIEGLPVMRYMKKNEKQTIITTALDMAIEALQEPERKWIPVSERLPDNYKEVLVQWEKTNRVQNLVVVFISVGLINEHGEWCNADGFGIFNGKVIAWQPLPECWKGESDG